MPVQTQKSAAPQATLKTRAQAEAQLKQLAHLTGLLGCAVAARDQEVLTIQARHQSLIETLGKDIAARKLLLEAWARANRAVEFGESQSLELPDGKLSFRKGNRKLEFLEGWDGPKTLEKLCSFPPESQWGEYVKREPQVDAERLLADTKGEVPRLPPSRLATIGLQITRGEKFHVEPRPGPAAFDMPH